jgi:glycosyltransferase involved in cell wall biosynthesis
MSETKTSVRLVSGSWPPEICGVGDFMANMSTATEQLGATAIRTRLVRGNLITALGLLFGSYVRRREVVYMSYPTEGYGKSLLPFLLAFGARQRVVLHIHEYGSKNRYCRFLLRRFQRLNRLFFSNAGDYQRYARDCGVAPDSPRTALWKVIPTPSNIPVLDANAARAAGKPRVVHFGQIRPNKGLEELALAFAEIGKQHDVDMVLLGGVPAGYEDYAREICGAFRSAGCQVRLNLEPAEISQELGQAHVGVFMFPDGADERRGSLIAAMAHGVLCVTTHSARTPGFLRDATIGVDTASGHTLDEVCGAVGRAVQCYGSAENRVRMDNARALGARHSFRGVALQMLATSDDVQSQKV